MSEKTIAAVDNGELSATLSLPVSITGIDGLVRYRCGQSNATIPISSIASWVETPDGETEVFIIGDFAGLARRLRCSYAEFTKAYLSARSGK